MTHEHKIKRIGELITEAEYLKKNPRSHTEETSVVWRTRSSYVVSQVVPNLPLVIAEFQKPLKAGLKRRIWILRALKQELETNI